MAQFLEKKAVLVNVCRLGFWGEPGGMELREKQGGVQGRSTSQQTPSIPYFLPPSGSLCLSLLWDTVSPATELLSRHMVGQREGGGLEDGCLDPRVFAREESFAVKTDWLGRAFGAGHSCKGRGPCCSAELAQGPGMPCCWAMRPDHFASRLCHF